MISLGAKFFHRLYLHAGSGGVAMFALSLVSLDQSVLRAAQLPYLSDFVAGAGAMKTEQVNIILQ